jgi:hypothetical protein
MCITFTKEQEGKNKRRLDERNCVMDEDKKIKR